MTYLTIRPLKSEVAEVVELMESAEYDGPESLATAVVTKCWELFAQRETWALAVENEDSELFWPFLNRGDVERFARDYYPRTEAGEKYSRLRMLSPAAQIARVEALKEEQ